MTFFYDLNKRLANLASKQDQRLAESKESVATAPKSQLAESMDVAEAGYSAKAGRAGKDLGKTGKNFDKIAKGAAERYGSKDAGKRVAGAVLAKLRHPSKVSEGTCPSCNCAPCECVEEGNAFTGKLKSTASGNKFKLGNKEFTDTSSIEEGFADMDAWLASREKEKGTGKFDRKERTLPGGMKATTYTRKHEEEPIDSDEEVSKEPKRRGRPKGKDKGPERVTAKSYKYKAGRPTKTKEDLDSDGVMMTRPSNMSSEGIAPGERAEYNDEAGMTKDSLHTIVRSAKELERALRSNENLPEWVQEKIGQIKGMMSSVTDYMLSTHERDIEQHTGEEGITLEKAPPGAKAERMVKHIKKAYSKDGKLSDKEKAIAYATTWKAKKAGKVEEEGLEKHSTSALKAAAGKDRTTDQKSGVPANFSTAQLKAELAKRSKVEEESTDKEDQKAERAGKRVAKDIEHDEGHKGKDDNRAERAGKKVTKDIEYDDKKDKEEKVAETTVAGSVATAPSTGKSSKGGMQFGKGVYEGFNNSVEKMISESITVESTMSEYSEGEMSPAITITADGEEAAKLMMLLKLAGLEGQAPATCSQCSSAPCGCAEVVDENSPDWPTNTEKLDAEPNLRTYSGGLNGPKSTGQTTIPVVASQLRRQASMEESVELENSLFNTWKNYKG